MRAQLTGNDFTVSALSPSDIQQLTSENVAEWSWQVTPRVAGDLVLTLTVVPTVDGVDLPGRTSNYRLAVRVGAGRPWPAEVGTWIGNNLVSLVATLAAVVGVVFSYLAYRHNRRERATPPTKPRPRPPLTPPRRSRRGLLL